MTLRRIFWCVFCMLWVFPSISIAQEAPFRVIAFYSKNAEYDHVQFANQAILAFREMAGRDHFIFDTTAQWEDLNPRFLKGYKVVLWLNGSPSSKEQRAAFQQYMDHGGAWLGFHASGYNDESTRWPWFVNFLGGAVFYGNNWPPLPARLTVDAPEHPAAKGLPHDFLSPANEWYIWKPDPRENKDVKVLLTLDPANYPLGLKDTIVSGDLPVVWSNTKYKMIYMNMGHGDKIFTDKTQNLLFENAILWLAGRTQ